MDDPLLFTPSKESHMNKLEDSLKALLKSGLKISSKKCQLFRISNTWETRYSFKIGRNV